MKNVVLAAWLAVLPFTCAAFAGAQSTPPQGGVRNITGDYAVQITGERFIVGVLHLTQVGDVVVGSAESATGGVLQINGKLAGDKISAQWRGPTGQTGWLTFNFDSAGTAFNGTYGYPGRAANGSIVSKKIRATAF